jgi:hypothetical protein
MRIHKKKAPTESRTRVTGVKTLCDGRYTIGADFVIPYHRCPQLVLPQLFLTEVSDVILFHYTNYYSFGLLFFVNWSLFCCLSLLVTE